tara:strand:- start:615 stop:1949 length:1335 start_codon:yes stop_codon:yes gene_type:complete
VTKKIFIDQTITTFKKKSIIVDGDKSLSIRFVLFSSLSKGKCSATNLLISEDVKSAINIIKKLNIKINLKNKKCEIFGKGLFGYKFKKNLILNAGNSGTTVRLLFSLLNNSNHWIKITGDQSLKKRDMSRIIRPLKLFGFEFKDNNKKLPILIKGPKILKPISYTENLGSAQCKSAIMIAALKANGKTKLKCLPSRNHSELMFNNVMKIPTNIYKKNNYEFIKLNGLKEIKPFKYNIPGDISSASFFVVLALLSKKSSLTIKDVNTNPTRIGIIKILNMMGSNIKFLNKRNYKGEEISDIYIKPNRNLKSIKLDSKMNSSAIDEFLLIFLVASISKGISIFNNLDELNKKESKRLDWGIKILKMIGVRVKKIQNNGVKIWGNPNLELKKSYIIKNYLKDHRIFMVSTIAALTLGGKWIIHNSDSFKTSFPNFLKILKSLGAKIK